MSGFHLVKVYCRWLKLWWVSFVVVMVTACGSRFPQPDHFKPDTSRYHRAMESRGKTIKSLSGELAVELWEGSKRVAIRQLFASCPPHQLRMDTLTPFEQPLATLIYHDTLLALHDIEHARFAVGEASADNFERLTRVKIRPSDMSALLSGQIPRLMTQGGVVVWDEEQGRSVLTLEGQDERQLIYFDESKLTPRVMEIYRQGELLLRLFLARYTEQEPYLPQRLRFEIPSKKIRVEIELKDFTINPELPDVAFEIKAPPGLSVSNL